MCSGVGWVSGREGEEGSTILQYLDIAPVISDDYRLQNCSERPNVLGEQNYIANPLLLLLLSSFSSFLCLMPHASCLMPHASCLMPRASCLVPHASCLQYSVRTLQPLFHYYHHITMIIDHSLHSILSQIFKDSVSRIL